MNTPKCNEFINTEYTEHPSWLELTPKGYRYDHGTLVKNSVDGSWGVHDGATNLMGYILPDGTFKSNSSTGEAPSEYEMSFLRTAKAALDNGTAKPVEDTADENN